jgi:1,4-alpha-glucan branching enzyme
MIKKRVAFKFNAPDTTREVKLCGNFTGWESGAIVMNRSKSGEWKTQVSLEPGEYEYKFWVDGVWQNDPASERRTSNNLGSENSVRVVSG